MDLRTTRDRQQRPQVSRPRDLGLVRHQIGLTTTSPRQVRNGDKAIDQIKEGPSDDDTVVNVQEENNRHSRVSHSF